MNDKDVNDLGLANIEPPEDGKALPKSRQDVEVTEQVYFGKPCYVLKDPTTLRYYRLRPPEYTIYRLLDGKSSLEDIVKVLAGRFPGEEYDSQAVMSFIIMLRGANLLKVPGETGSEYLLKRKKMLKRSLLKKIQAEFLFYRIPLFDPDRLLNYLHRRLGGLIYNKITTTAVLLMIAGALAMLIANIDKFGQRQPLLSWLNLLYLVPSLLIIKIIHEFGHGLTCKHFGSEVHEMGIMFLVFNPCPYCDVSDSWTITGKSKRMWITAAGITVEVVLAALATYVWALTVPKTVLNQFALNVMLVGSINTLLFNGNPLLRFDGYYFLMDLVEIPNLKQKGSNYLWYLGQRYLLGYENAQKPIDVEGREPAVIGYAICSAIYRWFIMIAITVMVWRFLDPYGWGIIGGIMALGCIYSSFIMPLQKLAVFLSNQRHKLHIHRAATAALVLLAVVVLGGVLLLPVEQSVETQCVIRPADAGMNILYVNQPGFISQEKNQKFVIDGQQVRAGDVLMVLSDNELEHKAADLELQLQILQKQRNWSIQQKADEEEFKVDAEIKKVQAQYDRAKHELNQLTFRAPLDGVLELRTGAPLDTLVGNFLSLHTPVFAVYQPGQFEAVAAVNHRENGKIQSGDPVEIKLWPIDNEVFASKVGEKPPAPVIEISSMAFSTQFGGEVPTRPTTDIKNGLVPEENTYECILPLGKDERFRDGMVGRAKFIIEEKTLAEAFYYWLISTLKLDIRL